MIVILNKGFFEKYTYSFIWSNNECLKNAWDETGIGCWKHKMQQAQLFLGICYKFLSTLKTSWANPISLAWLVSRLCLEI